jgi:hypothetical protein
MICLCVFCVWRDYKKRLVYLKYHIDYCCGRIFSTGQTILLKKVFMHKLNFFYFHTLCLAGLSALCLMPLLFATCYPLSPL